MQKEQAADMVLSNMTTQTLQCFAVMSFVLQPSKARAILLCSQSQAHLQALCAHLCNDTHKLDLQLDKAEEVVVVNSNSPHSETRLFLMAFQQGNLKASRKIIAPLMVDFEESR